jgi:plastocyanin
MTLRAALPAAIALLLSAPAAAGAATTTIAMPGKYFDPPLATTVAGDTVLFQNRDLVTHDVRMAGIFDSGPIVRFRSYSHAVPAPGSYPYICTIHAFMRGTIDVVAATLATDATSVLAGEPIRLSGRARAGTARVGIEQSVAGGPWTDAGAAATPAADGSFEATVRAVAGASYRPHTPDGAGAVVTPQVSARIDVHMHVIQGRRRTKLHVETMPATAGLRATLQLYARRHFRWSDYAKAALGKGGRARFRVPAGRRTYARILLRRRAHGPVLVTSDVVKLWNGRIAADPDTIMPPGGHHSMPDMPGGPDHGGH